MEYRLFATAEYMEFVCGKLKEENQLWCWANTGWYQCKIIWRIR